MRGLAGRSYLSSVWDNFVFGYGSRGITKRTAKRCAFKTVKVLKWPFQCLNATFFQRSSIKKIFNVDASTSTSDFDQIEPGLLDVSKIGSKNCPLASRRAG